MEILKNFPPLHHAAQVGSGELFIHKLDFMMLDKVLTSLFSRENTMNIILRMGFYGFLWKNNN